MVKKIVFLVFVVLMVLILVNRQRVYVRDPLATVYKSDVGQRGRNDVKQSGVQVYINYSNDVLLWKDAEPGSYRTLVQGWNRAPGTPMRLTCMRWMACLADADQAATIPIEGKGRGRYDPRVSMTSREVSFVDGDGATIRIELR